jgi:hypothetical protein
MNVDFDTWGPLTTLAVVGALIVLLGGAVSVVLGHMSFTSTLSTIGREFVWPRTRPTF